MNIKGIGELTFTGKNWEGYPAVLNGSLLSIESQLVTQPLESQAVDICTSWDKYIQQCLSYFKQQQYSAKQYSNPNVFINSENEWAIYFDTELGDDCVVGVNFVNNTPSRLIY